MSKHCLPAELIGSAAVYLINYHFSQRVTLIWITFSCFVVRHTKRFIGGRCIPLNLKHCNKEDGKPAEPREPGDSKPCSFPGLGALHCAGLSHACAEQRALRPSCPSTVLLPLEAMRNFAEISKAFGEMLWKCAAGGDWSAQGPLSNICAHGQRNPN